MEEPRFRIGSGILLLCLLLFAVLLRLVLAFYSLDRGMDITDEGLYLLWLNFPEKDPYPFYYFHHILLGLFPSVKWGISELRWLKVIIDPLIATLLASTFYRMLPYGHKTLLNGGLLLLGCSLGIYSTMYALTFYNGDISLLTTVVVIVSVIGYHRAGGGRRSDFWLLISGFFAVFQFFNKFSTSVLLLLLLFISVWSHGSSKKGYANIIVGGILGGAAFFLLVGTAPDDWWYEFTMGYELMVQFEKPSLVTILYEYVVHGGFLLLLSVPPLTIALLLKTLRIAVFRNLVITTSMVAAICWFLLYQFGSTGYWEYGCPRCPTVFHYWYFPLFSLLFSLLYYLTGDLRPSTKVPLWLMALIPLMAVVGTGSVITVGISAYLMPVFGLVTYLALLSGIRTWAMSYLALIALMGMFLFQWQYPFRQLAPRHGQLVEVNVPVGASVRLDHGTAEMVSGIRQVLDSAKVKMPYPIVAFYDMPGVVFLCGGYSPGTPWFLRSVFSDGNETWEIEPLHRFNVISLTRAISSEEDTPVLLVDERYWKYVSDYCHLVGIRVEDTYASPVKVTNPYVVSEREATGLLEPANVLVFVPKSPPATASGEILPFPISGHAGDESGQ